MKGAPLLLKLFLCLCLPALACGTLRPSPPDRTIRVHIEESFFRTSNGYSFVVVEDPEALLARVDVRYPVGAAADPPGKEGLAHLAEHLLFEFDIERGGARTSLFKEFARLSTSFDASTDEDYMHFESQGLPEALPDLLSLEATRATFDCSLIRQEIFEREKEIVLSELRERLGPEGQDLRAHLRSVLYPAGHPYHSVESLTSIAALSLDDVCKFLEGPLRQGMATVVVSGNVENASVQALVAKRFGTAAPRVGGTATSVDPIAPSESTTRIKADVSAPVFMVAWPLPAQSTRDYRLVQLLREKLEDKFASLAYSYDWGHNVDSWIAGSGRAPILILRVVLRSTKAVEMAREAFPAAARATYTWESQIVRKGRTGKSRTWKRRNFEDQARLLASYESLPSRAHMLSDYLLYEGDQHLFLDKLAELDDLTQKQVRSVGEKWLAPSRASIVILLPGDQRGHGRAWQSFSAPAHRAYRATAVDALDVSRAVVVPPTTGLSMDATRYVTANGLQVVLWPHGKLPLIHARLVTRSGSALDPSGAEGVAWGAGLDTTYRDSMVHGDRDLSVFIDELLTAVAEKLRFPGSSLSERGRGLIRGLLGLGGVAEAQNYDTRMLQAVFGKGHPYTRALVTSKTVGKLTHDNLKGWARRHIVPKNSSLILSGRFDVKEAKGWVAYLTDHLDAGAESPPVEAPRAPAGPHWIVGDGPPASPTLAFQLLFPGGPAIDDKHAARAALEGILTIKFAELLRKHALNSTMDVRHIALEAGGYWRLLGHVDVGRAEEAGRVVRELLDELRRDPEGYRRAFAQARRKEVDVLLASTSNPRAIADRLEYIARFDLPANFYDRLIRQVASLELDAITALIREELSLEHQVLGAYGQGDAARSFLRAAGMAGP